MISPTRRSPAARCSSPRRCAAPLAARCRSVLVMVLNLPSGSASKFAALGEQFERARVDPPVALVFDPVDPGLPRPDLVDRGPEPDVGSELGRCAEGSVKALAQPGLLNQRAVQPLARTFALLACHGPQPFGPSVGGRAQGRERVRPSERSSVRPSLLRCSVPPRRAAVVHEGFASAASLYATLNTASAATDTATRASATPVSNRPGRPMTCAPITAGSRASRRMKA